jgi:hypothetical protein
VTKKEYNAQLIGLQKALNDSEVAENLRHTAALGKHKTKFRDGVSALQKAFQANVSGDDLERDHTIIRPVQGR